LFGQDVVRKLNQAGIKNLDVDLLRVEQFFQRLGGDRGLQSYLAEARQLINLLQTENIVEFAEPQTRKAKYSQLNNTAALVAPVSKLLDASRVGMFGKKAEKTRMKQLEEFLLFLQTNK
jgi:hypothetical protein